MITVIANLKGGTGKSTVAFNLGLWLARRKVSVFMLDLDPQQTLADTMDIRREDGLLPSPDLAVEIGALATLPAHVQEVIVDVGPSDLPTMYEAIKRSDRVVLPVPPSQADVWSTQRFAQQAIALRGDAHKPDICAFINRADTHQAVRESDETFEALRRIEGIEVLAPRLKQRMAFRRSFSEGMSVEELDRRGKAARELDALARVLFPSYARRKGRTV